MTKALRKCVMKRSQLEKICFTKRTQESFKKYKNKKITVVDYTNERKSFFESIDSSKITGNKTFGKKFNLSF